MAVFTPVSRAELAAWLTHYPLGSLLDMQPVPEGVENTNYFVTTDRGCHVLTLFEKLRADELPFFLGLMDHLARHGIPCPAAIADHNGSLLGTLNGKPACIAPRLAGRSIVHPTEAQCAQVGALLARLHLAGLDFPGRMADPRGADWRTQAAQAVSPFLSVADLALLENEVALHAENPLADTPQGIIHADLFRDNVLMEDGKIGGLVDFYFACNGSLLYDVAITVNDWCLTPSLTLDKTRTRSLLGAYHAVRPFTAGEAAAWPLALRVAALRFWLSRLYDWHLPRAGALVKPRDPGHFKAILENHIAASQSCWL